MRGWGIRCFAGLLALLGWLAAGPDGVRAAAPPVSLSGHTLWVLAVGVSQYRDTSLNLAFAARDAEAVAKELNGSGLPGPHREVRSLVLTDHEVTRTSVLDGLASFFRDARPEDVAVIFVAGHGVRDRTTGSYYFLPADASARNHVTAGIRMTDFDDLLRVVRRSVRAVVLLFDTCHAGALRIGAPNLEALDDPGSRLTASEGFFLLAASKPGEPSEERRDLGHGTFTHALLEALRGAADRDEDGILTVNELFAYVGRRVEALTDGSQHPYSKMEGTDFALLGRGHSDPGSAPRPVWSPVPPLTRGQPTPQTDSIAVVGFRNLRNDPSQDWVGIALRTAFNTELSKIPALRVFAPELLERTMQRDRLDEIAAAQGLGVSRLVGGSYSVLGDSVRVDARIVDTASGVQEGSDSVRGRLDDFFDLQGQLVVRLLRRLRVTTQSRNPASTGEAGTRQLDAYRLLLESEGELDSLPAPPPSRPSQTPREGASSAPRPWRSLLGWLIRTAHAEPKDSNPSPTSVQAGIEALLDSYRAALEARDPATMAKLYAEFPDKRRETLARYLASADGLRVTIEDVRIDLDGPDPVVSFTRKDQFTDRDTGRPVQLEVRLTRAVTWLDGRWKIAGKP